MIQRLVERSDLKPAIYEPGDFVRLFGYWFNRAGQPADPENAILHLIAPCDHLRIYTSERGSVRRLRKGVYCFDLIAGQLGEWLYRWLWTDSLIVLPALSVPFEVRESRW